MGLEELRHFEVVDLELPKLEEMGHLDSQKLVVEGPRAVGTVPGG